MSQPEAALDLNKSFLLLAQFVESAQQKGAFLLPEAELLKRAVDVLNSNAEDKELDKNASVNLLIQGVQKGQRHGAYTLADAALLHKVISFLVAQSQQQAPQQQAPQQLQTEHHEQLPTQVQQEGDLSELALPVPLKPKEI